MRLNIRLLVSLIIIFAIGWVNVDIAGNSDYARLSMKWQLIHFCLFVATALIGYFNWKRYHLSWMITLWVFAYGFITALLLIAGGLHFLKIENAFFKQFVLQMRNIFTGPFPFLGFYMLQLLMKSMGYTHR